MHSKIFTSITLTAVIISGCANMTETQKGTAQGAGIGAGVGAVVGAVTGGTEGAVIGATVGAVAGGIAGNVWSTKMQEQKKQMEVATAGTGVKVSQTSDNRLKLDIPSDISFDVNRADIKPNFRTILDTFAKGLAKNTASNITIIGHTDSSGSDVINNPLSLSRAQSVRDYLVNRNVTANRLSIEGRGSREPLVANDSTINKAKNRRVEIYVAETAQ
jgi:outer membrane protein OmpA-like peptidoglycan-associated protein